MKHANADINCKFPVDVFGRPYTKETFLWWREHSQLEREQMVWEGKRPDCGLEGVEKLLKEFKRG